MKLSDIRGERVFDVIADIIDPIANIAEDDDAAALFRREQLPEGMTSKKFLLKRARKAAPALLRGHKADLVAILSTIEGTSPEEYTGLLSFAKLLKDVVELLTDDAFTELFITAQTGTGGESSGSARESTTESDGQSPS